jgi:hypothetical protein
MDIDLISGNETVRLPMLDALANPKAPAANDTGNMGVISAKAIAPDPIGTDTPKKPKPSATDLFSNVPSSGRHG